MLRCVDESGSGSVKGYASEIIINLFASREVQKPREYGERFFENAKNSDWSELPKCLRRVSVPMTWLTDGIVAEDHYVFRTRGDTASAAVGSVYNSLSVSGIVVNANTSALQSVAHNSSFHPCVSSTRTRLSFLKQILERVQIRSERGRRPPRSWSSLHHRHMQRLRNTICLGQTWPDLKCLAPKR